MIPPNPNETIAEANQSSIGSIAMNALPNHAKPTKLYDLTVEIIQEKIEQGIDLNTKDYNGHTQLHIAANRNCVEVAEYILKQPFQKIDIDAQDNYQRTPLHLAKTKNMVLLLIKFGASLIIRDFNQQRSLKVCLERVKLPADYFFSKGIKDSIKVCSLLPYLRSPIKELNRIFLENPKTGKSIISELFMRYLRQQDSRILKYMVEFHHYLQLASKIKVTEQNDIVEILNRVERMVLELFNCNSMDMPINVQRILQPGTDLSCYTNLETQLRRQSLPLNSIGADAAEADLKTLNRQAAQHRELERKNAHMLQMVEAHAFQDRGILQFCRNHEIKIIFDKPQVSGFVNELFTTFLYKTDTEEQSMLVKKMLGICYSSHINKKSYKFLLQSITLRSCPMVLFIIEFLSKVFSLLVVAAVSIQVYGKKYEANYSDDSVPDKWERSEILLVILTITHILYEVGQLSDCNWKLKVYFSDEWNFADVIDFTLNLVWMILRFSSTLDSHQFHTARIVLSLVSIPQSIGLLRFLAIYKPLGELVIMLKVMFKELLMFVVIFVMCTIGFGITFFGLFYHTDQFSTGANTALTLFQYTLSNFDFSAFEATSETVNYIGIMVLVVYLLIVTIVLVNLLIARMTNSYQKVDDRALAEWSFDKASTVEQFLLLHEHHPFCMLPAPFNLITTVLYPVHYFYLPKGFSLGGTVCNILYAYLGGIIRVFIVIGSFLADFFIGLYVLLWRWKFPDVKVSSVFSLILMPISLIYTIYLAPLILCPDLVARVNPQDGTLLFLHEALHRDHSKHRSLPIL